MYHQHVGHQLDTVRSPLQVHERRTVYRQSSAQPPKSSQTLPSKKNLNRFFLYGCDGVHENSHLSNANADVQIRTNANANIEKETKIRHDEH